MSKPSPTYPPLNCMKPVGDGIWIVDGPTIRFGLPWPKLVFPTRMTVIRLSDGDLVVHSPTLLTPRLRAEVEREGRVAHLIGPNRIHYWWLPDWRAAFPEAEVWLAPRIREQAGTRIDFPAHDIDAETGFPWDGEIDTVLVRGSYMSEAEFFHRASRTLILTDLIENFEGHKVGSWPKRLFYRLAGVLDPHGSTPRDLRRVFGGKQGELRSAVERMISFDPERVIVAHGRWYDRDGTAELRRAFSWLFD